MGYALLWFESLAASLLWTATVFAWTARRNGRWRNWIDTGAAFIPLLVYGGLAVFVGYLEFGVRVHVGWFVYLLLLTVASCVGAAWLAWKRPKSLDGEQLSTGADWPFGKLATAFVAALALHAMTLWNLDAAVKQRMAIVRAEAGQLSLSVAPERLPDELNAAPLYHLAFESLGSESFGPAPDWPEVWNAASKAIGEDRKSFDFKDAALGKFLESKAPELSLLREAASRPGCFFARDFGRPSIAMRLPEVDDSRKAARLLAIDARREAAVGNYQRALEDTRALFGFARHIGSESLLITLLVSAAIHRMACDTLEAVLMNSDLTAEDLALVDVDAAYSYRRLSERGLLAEEAFGLSTFSDLGEGRWDYGDFMKLVAMSETHEWTSPPGVGILYRVFLLEDDVRAYRELFGEQSRAANMWYRDAKQRLGGFDARLHDRRPGLISGLLVPALARFGERMAEADARRRCALAALGMYRYRARHGSFPSELAPLAPEFVPLVPLDPYDGRPLRLKHDKDHVLIYCLGPDLVDDHGAPLDRNREKGDVVFQCGKAP